jgi:predicted transcriptional regulator
VTATVENGTATIKLTPGQGSAEAAVAPETVTTANHTTSTNTTVDPAILALFNRTNGQQDPTPPATGGNGCSDAAKALNVQIKRVNDAFKTDVQALAKLRHDARTDVAKKAVADAFKNIAEIRQNAVKAIHATNPSATCKTDDDEKQGANHDMDDEDDNDVDDEQEGDHDDKDKNGTKPPVTGGAVAATTTTTVAFTGDAKAIADAAISAMALWVTDAQKAVAGQPAATTTTNAANKAKTDNKSNKTGATKHDNKGKGGDKGQHEAND